MATFSGTVTKSDLEGGAWLLRSEQGVMYQLQGGDEALRKDGQRVEIEGDIASQTVGIAMMGDVLQVRSYRVVS